ncbi:hypothetical protein D9619_009839 [Psilocybe cf. subviscida]|uniref:DNA 3'-5' helicase n=1 Tax=Psilocybe cf. subviscida TaxID=2480587 RepID=A0A8H5BKJ6_9AGAR|nr:hypothetical protein D9619_009839 [Psilocybe cf. subviscida]
MSSDDEHAVVLARSYRNLQAAREKAAEDRGYDSASMRNRLTVAFERKFNVPPYPWQLDVTEAMLVGLDSLSIAGTGSGKTIPFFLPLMADPTKQMVIISPLKILQDDQVSRCHCVGVSAAAVNGDTWNKKMAEDLKQRHFRAILTSPEMCLKVRDFRNALANAFDNICTVAIDEAHCISQWGGDFRTAYSKLGKLCAFFPPHIPIHATTATLTPQALKEVRKQLDIDETSSFHLNLGNDCPNIAFSARVIKSADNYNSIRPFLTRTATIHSPDDLVKTIVSKVGYLYALRSPGVRRKVMEKFCRGEITILIATEAAGMGADIPDIEQVIQFGVPSSLSVWMQRAGRAGRSPSMRAHAILLCEKAMFQQQSKQQKKSNESNDVDAPSTGNDSNHESSLSNDPDTPEVAEDAADSDGEDDNELEEDDSDTPLGSTDRTVPVPAPVPLAPGKSWKKKVKEFLRQWIETQDCRRKIANVYFDNPPSMIKAPTHVCCDNCQKAQDVTEDALSADVELEPAHPVTPQPTIHSAHTTPSNTPNGNHKRPMTFAKATSLPPPSSPTPMQNPLPDVDIDFHGPNGNADAEELNLPAEDKIPAPLGAPRRGARLKVARTALETWRIRKKPRFLTSGAFMPDSVLWALSASTNITSTHMMEATVHWAYVLSHGDNVLKTLKHADDTHLQEVQAAKDAKAAKQLALKVARDKEKQQQKVAEQERKAEEKQKRDEQKARERAIEKEEENRRKAERAVERAKVQAAEKEAKAAARKAKKRKTADVGVLSFTVQPTTPVPMGGLSSDWEPSSTSILQFQSTPAMPLAPAAQNHDRLVIWLPPRRLFAQPDGVENQPPAHADAPCPRPKPRLRLPLCLPPTSHLYQWS